MVGTLSSILLLQICAIPAGFNHTRFDKNVILTSSFSYKSLMDFY